MSTELFEITVEITTKDKYLKFFLFPKPAVLIGGSSNFVNVYATHPITGIYATHPITGIYGPICDDFWNMNDVSLPINVTYLHNVSL